MTAVTAGQQLYIANSQWGSRPDDQRFTSLADLEVAVAHRTEIAEEKVLTTKQLAVVHGDDEANRVFLPGASGPVDFSHYSFSQFATLAGAPAGYLRTLPPTLVAENLNYGLEQNAPRDTMKVLAQPANGERGMVRAFTSEKYGRIWDLDVVRTVARMNEAAGDRWHIPSASYASSDPKRATTLYASDHDTWLFLVDDQNPIEAGADDVLFRGFVAFNSEVGDRTFGLITFLYRYVCDNRIIWGAEDVTQLFIRHSQGGPYRFESEAAPVLKEYANTVSAPTVKMIEAAKTTFITPTAFVNDDEREKALVGFLKGRDFTGPAITATVQYVKEQDRGANVWDVVNGLTSYAHNLAHTDSRITVERKASALMELAAS